MKPNPFRMSEDQLLTSVLDAARALGYLACHFRPARTAQGWRTALQGDKGWPDLMIAGHGRLILAELKGERGTMDPEQIHWRTLLEASGTEYHLWRPQDWRSGAILRTLTRRPDAD